ncbi:LYR motif-containing protein 4 [Microdochium nivale]|nr:LYR motif-containing protein 4 [Microdochium nivale]
MATQQTVHAYRHLYRCLLHAVQFSKPARYVARDRLRVAFRQKDAVLDSQSISRTLQFLQAAARERGLEHKVLKNLLMTQFFRAREQQKSWKAVKLEQSSKNKRTDLKEHLHDTAFCHYDKTVEMLNKSLGLCLR